MKKKYLILLGFLPNPRIYKRIDVMKDRGDVDIICWDRGRNMLSRPSSNNELFHIIDIPARNNPLKRMIPYQKFVNVAINLMGEIKPDVILVQGLDMLAIANRYKKRNLNVKLIYEVADLHRLIVDRSHSIIERISKEYLMYMDKRCSKNLDLLIVTSQKYYDEYFVDFVIEEKMLYFPNVPNLHIFDTYKPKDHNTNFTIGYIGAVRYKNQIRNMIQAATVCGVNILIAGYESDPIEIDLICNERNDIERIGQFEFERDAANLYGKCDVIFSVYNAEMKNVRVALPNKLYEAIYCEIPIIVAKDTYLAQVVKTMGVGVAVDHKSVNELIGVLKRMSQDSEYYNRFVLNCKRHKEDIDLKKYNEIFRKCLDRIEG